MKQALLVAELAFALLGIACDDAPRRPASVPTEAIWAGVGSERTWIVCRFATKEPRNEYDCETFRGDGRPWTAGVYVLGSDSGGTFRPFAGPFAPSPLDYALKFDGNVIQRTDTTVLVPDGWIEYYEAAGDKQVLFDRGRRVEPADAKHAG